MARFSICKSTQRGAEIVGIIGHDRPLIKAIYDETAFDGFFVRKRVSYTLISLAGPWKLELVYEVPLQEERKIVPCQILLRNYPYSRMTNSMVNKYNKISIIQRLIYIHPGMQRLLECLTDLASLCRQVNRSSKGGTVQHLISDTPEETQQFEAALTPPPVEGVSHHGSHTSSGSPSLKGSQQFKEPAASLPGIPTTPTLYAQPAVDPRIRQQVQYYADWLAKQAKYDVLNDHTPEINAYIQEATKVVKVGEKEVAIFAPFRQKHSALQTFTPRQVIALCLIGLLWALGLLVFRLEMLTAVIGVITVMYTFNLILSLGMAVRAFRNSPEEHIDDAIVHALKNANWPLYTILCPLYREAQVVPQFVQSMQSLDYPPEKLQILFLTEADDAETRNAIQALSLPPHFKILVVPDGKPRTKPRACNYGLIHAQGSYVVIYDAEDIPDPLQLKKSALTFANHGTDVVCVQAKLNFYNIRQNLLTRWFTAEYSAWFDLILPGLHWPGSRCRWEARPIIFARRRCVPWAAGTPTT